MDSVISTCRAVGARVRRLTLWAFAPRQTLEGGLVVYKGQLLAEGGFSYVYVAYDVQQNHRRVVLKEVRVDEPEQYEQAVREIEHHKRFDHPNLMPLLDHLIIGGNNNNNNNQGGGGLRVALLAFPLCPRGSLRDVINLKVLDLTAPHSTRWRHEEFARLFEGSCAAARAVHAAGFSHRDIKPENVLIGDDGRPVLTDFGSMGPAVVRVDTRRDALVLQDHARTHSTMTYRAPELWDPEVSSTGDPIDATKADVWALGCLLWAMAFGYSPFEADFPAAGATTSTSAGAQSGTKARGSSSSSKKTNDTTRAPSPRPRIVETSHLRVLSTPAPPPVEILAGTAHDVPFFRLVEATARLLLVPDPGGGGLCDGVGPASSGTSISSSSSSKASSAAPPPSSVVVVAPPKGRPDSERALQLAARLVAYPDSEQ